MAAIEGAPSLPIPRTALEAASAASLIEELILRGMSLRSLAVDVTKQQQAVLKGIDQLQTTGKEALDGCKKIVTDSEHEVKKLTAHAKEVCKALTVAAKEECRHVTEAIMLEGRAIAEKTETTCLSRAEALEVECLKRVEAAESTCRELVDKVTKECASLAKSAEDEAYRCVEESEKAVAATNALGVSFNTLNERLHNIEISLRTIFSSGAGFAAAPVYAAPPQPAPAPVVPTPVPVPAVKRLDANGQVKMHFVLLGLHWKDAEKIRQKLRSVTARHSTLTIIEDTTRDVLPKHADYAIVSGAHDLALRWKFCLDSYGSAKCVRLDNGSINSFRIKIEELYEARYPSTAPEKLASVGSVLNQSLSAAQ